MTIPPEVQGKRLVVSVSGGKDSTATMLFLREAGLEATYVFSDTGWEAPETYAYLDMLSEKLGPIHRVGFPGGMRAKIEARGNFPIRMARWCTRELKLQPLREFHNKLIDESGIDTISVVGIRAEESPSRAKMPLFGWDDTWDGYIWRPLLDYSVAEVLAIHYRHNIPINPLYEAGFSRVGCWPCIFSSKEEIRALAEYSPDRIREIAELEKKVEAIRHEQNLAKPGRHSYEQATFFQTRDGINPMYIDEIVAWSKQKKGLPILTPPNGGCYRWGLCEPQAVEKHLEEVRVQKDVFDLAMSIGDTDG